MGVCDIMFVAGVHYQLFTVCIWGLGISDLMSVVGGWVLVTLCL